MHRFRYSTGRTKYGAKRQEYNGIFYHSKKEAAYAAELDLRKKSGDIKGWERQFKVDLKVEGNHVSNYYVDFLIHHNDETKEYVEVKGFETPEWRLKWKLFEAIYGSVPQVRLTIVK